MSWIEKMWKVFGAKGSKGVCGFENVIWTKIEASDRSKFNM